METAAEPTSDVNLVAGRICGSCIACCVLLPVRATGFKKMPSTKCEHCRAGGGCKIYETRPDACRSFNCMWLQAPNLDDVWRPDRSGVLITEELDDIPEGFKIRPGFQFMVFAERTALDQPVLAGFIADLVAARVPAFLSIPGPPGCYAAKLFLNNALSFTVRTGDKARVSAVLQQGYDTLKTFKFKPAPADLAP